MTSEAPHRPGQEPGEVSPGAGGPAPYGDHPAQLDNGYPPTPPTSVWRRPRQPGGRASPPPPGPGNGRQSSAPAWTQPRRPAPELRLGRRSGAAADRTGRRVARPSPPGPPREQAGPAWAAANPPAGAGPARVGATRPSRPAPAGPPRRGSSPPGRRPPSRAPGVRRRCPPPPGSRRTTRPAPAAGAPRRRSSRTIPHRSGGWTRGSRHSGRPFRRLGRRDPRTAAGGPGPLGWLGHAAAGRPAGLGSAGRAGRPRVGLRRAHHPRRRAGSRPDPGSRTRRGPRRTTRTGPAGWAAGNPGPAGRSRPLGRLGGGRAGPAGRRGAGPRLGRPGAGRRRLGKLAAGPRDDDPDRSGGWAAGRAATHGEPAQQAGWGAPDDQRPANGWSWRRRRTQQQDRTAPEESARAGAWGTAAPAQDDRPESGGWTPQEPSPARATASVPPPDGPPGWGANQDDAPQWTRGDRPAGPDAEPWPASEAARGLPRLTRRAPSPHGWEPGRAEESSVYQPAPGPGISPANAVPLPPQEQRVPGASLAASPPGDYLPPAQFSPAAEAPRPAGCLADPQGYESEQSGAVPGWFCEASHQEPQSPAGPGGRAAYLSPEARRCLRQRVGADGQPGDAPDRPGPAARPARRPRSPGCTAARVDRSRTRPAAAGRPQRRNPDQGQPFRRPGPAVPLRRTGRPVPLRRPGPAGAAARLRRDALGAAVVARGPAAVPARRAVLHGPGGEQPAGQRRAPAEAEPPRLTRSAGRPATAVPATRSAVPARATLTGGPGGHHDPFGGPARPGRRR